MHGAGHIDSANAERYLTFVFVGAGYAGVEPLAELMDLVRDAMRHCRVQRRGARTWRAAALRRRTGTSRPSTGTSRSRHRIPPCRLGRATFRIVLSSPMMSSDSESAARL